MTLLEVSLMKLIKDSVSIGVKVGNFVKIILMKMFKDDASKNVIVIIIQRWHYKKYHGKD